MDAKSLRTLNIRGLVAAAGGPTEFSELTGGRWAPGQVSQWTSDSNPKGIGHALARDIETALGKPHGWLDRSHPKGAKYLEQIASGSPRKASHLHDAASQPAGLDLETLLMVLEELEIAIQRSGAVLEPELKARVILSLYVQHAAGAIDPAERVSAALAAIVKALQEQKA
jgi:hypothetical protein